MDADARGILNPNRMRQLVALNRYPAGRDLDGLVEWFWAVTWTLPPGTVHTQQVLTHPGAILSVGDGEPGPDGVPGPPEAALHGVATRLSSRRLAGSGWTVAALTLPGGLGALVPAPASRLTDRVVPLLSGAGPIPGPIPGLSGDRLLAEIVAAGSGPDAPAREPERVDVLRDRLAAVVADADPARVAAAREVAALARLAESDRTLRRARDLARSAGVTVRTLQRMFAELAGVSPAWVLRRYRLLDAAERARRGQPVSWAAQAAELGFSDQAHLVREFRAHLGVTPAAYAAGQA